ncbi:MAG TPA: replicative DNA helicase, partial [Bacilli bacterium]
MNKERRIPYNLEAEKYILGCLFIEPQIIGEVLSRISPNDFYLKEHQNIMQAIVNLYENNELIDQVKVANELQRMNLLEASGGIDYLFEIIESIPSVANIDAYLEVIEEKSLLRELLHVTDKIRDKVLEGDLSFADIGAKAEEEMLRVINMRRTEDVKKIHRFTNHVLDIIESNKENEGKLSGLDTGFEELNKLTFGFQKGELIVLAARPGIGKSAFALNVASNACKKDKSVAFFSLEMGVDQLTMRLFSSFSGLSISKIRSGKLNDKEMSQLLVAKATIDKFNLYLDETSNTNLNDIKAKCLKLKREGLLDLIIVDYLQLINVPNFKGNRVEEVGKVSRGLKMMARELDVPVLALSQLSRGVEASEDKRPRLAHLRESGSIEQDADIVMFLHREQPGKEIDETKQVRNHKTELIIAKNRQGATDSIFLLFKGAQSM